MFKLFSRQPKFRSNREASADADLKRWIFVSHASQDIEVVRDVRNHLESRGASPLLFHLRSLATPEQFWPIIEREIAARNFFLFCESAAADVSVWVQRERRTIERLRTETPKIVGSIRVDAGHFDASALQRFLSLTRVHLVYSRYDQDLVKAFSLALRRAGFEVALMDVETTPFIPTGEQWATEAESNLMAAAQSGWIAVFLSKNLLESEWSIREFEKAIHIGARIVPILLEKTPLDGLPRRVAAWLRRRHIMNAYDDKASAPGELVKELLTAK